MTTIPPDEPEPVGYSSSLPGYVPPPPSSALPPIGQPIGTPTSAPLPPSVFGAYGRAWSLLIRDFVPLVVIAVVYWLVGSGVSLVLGFLTQKNGLVSFAYTVFVGGPLLYGLAHACVEAARGRTPTVADLWVPFQTSYLKVVGSYVVTVIAVGIGLVLLIVPGIVLAVRFAFVPFIVIEENVDPFDALGESWRRTSGFSWTVFGAALLAIPIAIIGFILVGVGIIPASMFIYLAFASLYLSITARKRGIV